MNNLFSNNNMSIWYSKFTNGLLSKLSFYFTASLLSSFVRIILILILTKFFGKEEFGIWAVFTSSIMIAAYIGDLGITNALRNKLSFLINLDSTSNQEERNCFFTAFTLITFLCIIYLIIIYLLGNEIPFEKLFNTENTYIKSQGKELFLAIQYIIILTIPFGIANAAFFSYNESNTSAVFLIIQTILSFIYVLICLYYDKTIVFVSVGYLLIVNGSYLISFGYFIFRRNWFQINLTSFKGSYFINSKSLLTTGVKFFSFDSSRGYLENIGTLLVSIYLGTGEAAEFNVIQKIYTFINGVFKSIFNPLWAVFSEKIYQGNWEGCIAIFNKSVKYVSGIYLVVIIINYFIASYILKLLIGTNYVFDDVVIFLLGISSFAFILFSLCATFQSSINKIVFLSIIMVLLSILCSIVFDFGFITPSVRMISFILCLVWILAFLLSYIETKLILKRKII